MTEREKRDAIRRWSLWILAAVTVLLMMVHPAAGVAFLAGGVAVQRLAG